MIAIIGLGFVGLTTALGFAHKGYKVYGFDIDFEKRAALKRGKIPFHEPFLGLYLKKYKNSKLIICDKLEEAIVNASIVFYCVGTPSKKDGSANLGFLKSAVADSLRSINEKSFKTLVIKSTIPPSTTLKIVKPLIEKTGFQIGINIGLANNPEFLREGSSWEDFIHPDRIVIGEHDPKSSRNVVKIYKAFHAPIFRVSLNTAEFVKYLSNTLLATLISFSNEMSMIAQAVEGIDIPTSFKILHVDRRWSGAPAKMTSYVYPGCGFGGYCLPKDTLALKYIAEKSGISSPLIKKVLLINDQIKNHFVQEITKNAAKKDTIGFLGLSFKPDSDDVRETPAKGIIDRVIHQGYRNIIAYDPMAMKNFNKQYGLPIKYADSIESLAFQSTVVVLLTSWKVFKKNSRLLKGKKIIDGRYFL